MNIKRWGFTPFLIIGLLFLVVATWYNYRFKPLSQKTTSTEILQNHSNQAGVEKTDDSTTAQTESDKAFANLSDKQKVGLTLAFPLLVDEQVTASISAQVSPGFITLFGSMIDQLQIDQVSQQLEQVFVDQPWPPIIAVDHEGGLVQRLSGQGYTRLETWYDVCGQDEADRLKVESEVVDELALSGIGVVFGPVVDLYQAGSSLGKRSCSGDPQVVIDRSLELMRFYTEQGILPVIKHYPGLGQSRRDLHQAFEVITNNQKDLQPFISILSQQPLSGVMVSHVGITDLSSTPCSLTKSCVGTLLEQFPKTLVFSDALDMQAVYASPNLEIEKADLLTASRLGLEAGIDVLVFGQGVSSKQMQQVSDGLVELYQQDSNFKILVDAHARKIWDYRQIYWN